MSLLISRLGQRQHYQLVGSRVKNKSRNHLAITNPISVLINNHFVCLYCTTESTSN